MVVERLILRHRAATITRQTFSQTCRFSSSNSSSSSSSSAPRQLAREAASERQSKISGRYQWWNIPAVVTPDVHPLEDGPDFTFCDGRPTPLSTRKQVERKLEQIELGKRIVERLDELKEIEAAHRDSQRLNEKSASDYQRQLPKAKGKPLKL
uniref:Large ribosomal subunit protein mL52 n=1 Tax=Plectus sambesii TaxID=2011161 RepID=A0A914UTZ3_9BILA